MVSSRLRFRPILAPHPTRRTRRTNRFPAHLTRIRDIEAPHIVERAHAIPTAKDVDAVAPETCRMRAALTWLLVAGDLGLRPAEAGGVEHVDVVVVGGTVAAAEDD